MARTRTSTRTKKVDQAGDVAQAANDAPASAAPAAGVASMRKELVENQMYETAALLFAQRGFAGTSLQDIADAMGITRPALYYYVKSKDELLAKLVTEITEGNTAEILKFARSRKLDPVEKLSKIAHVMAYHRALHPTRFLLLARSEAELPEGLAELHESTKRTMLRNLIEVIKDGVAAGQFRPVNPKSAALAVIGMCNWVAWWFHEEDAYSAAQVADDITNMAVASLIRAGDRITAAKGPRAAAVLLRQDLDYLDRLLDEADKKP